MAVKRETREIFRYAAPFATWIGLQAVLHDGDLVLQLLHVRLLVLQEVALLQQLLAIGRLAHPALKAVRLHVHLHELPQGIQLHTNSLHTSEKHFRFALQDAYVILYRIRGVL